MAKYSIRQPFAVHLETMTDTQKGDGTTVKTRNQQSFFPGQPIELTDADAMAHFHKLEPADAESKKLFDAFHKRQSDAIKSRDPEDNLDDRIAAAVAAAVADALAKAGVGQKAAAGAKA